MKSNNNICGGGIMKSMVFQLLAVSMMTATLSGCTLFKKKDRKTLANEYYEKYQLSLEGAETRDSEVDELFHSLTNGKYAAERVSSKYGEKFFVTFVQRDCSACEEYYGAFKTLEKNWGKKAFGVLDGQGEFKLYTIFIDSTNDKGENLFEYFYNGTGVYFFKDTLAATATPNHPYFNKTKCTSYQSDLDNMLSFDNFSTPTTLLIDFSKKAPEWTTSYGVREILFNFEYYEEDSDLGRAYTLRNAWSNHQSSMHENNPFAPVYPDMY